MKQIDINKEVLSKYSDDQLAAWAQDNELTAADLKEVKASLKKKSGPEKAEGSQE